MGRPATGGDSAAESAARTGSISGAELISTGVSPATSTVTFGLGGDGVAALARTTSVGNIALHLTSDTLARSAVDWRPPLIAMPAFQGTADSAAMGTAFREAMVVGMPGVGDRPVIAVLLCTIVACGWLLLARLGWSEPVIAPREKVPGSPPTFVAPPPPAADPRRPEDITNQTARHTAMHR